MRPWRFEILGVHAGFARPELLGLIAVAVALAAVALVVASRRRKRVETHILPPLSHALSPGVSTARPLVNASLYGLALVLFAVALAEPQCGSRTELVKRRGIDLVVALDASKSMLARDVSPDRISRAKLELDALLDDLKGDRVGIVAFSGAAFIQCPLTSDYAAAKMFLRAVDPMQMDVPGTDIGDALTLAKKMLDGTDRGAEDRVVVLLSDGEDLAGDDVEAAKALASDGIRIYAVGIGSTRGEPIPELDAQGNVVGYKEDDDGKTVLSRLDASGLKKLARITGGEYFHQPNGVAMGQVVAQVDKLKKADFGSKLAVRYAEKFQDFAFPGLAMLLLGMFLPLSTRRRPADPAPPGGAKR